MPMKMSRETTFEPPSQTTCLVMHPASTTPSTIKCIIVWFSVPLSAPHNSGQLPILSVCLSHMQVISSLSRIAIGLTIPTLNAIPNISPNWRITAPIGDFLVHCSFPHEIRGLCESVWYIDRNIDSVRRLQARRLASSMGLRGSLWSKRISVLRNKRRAWVIARVFHVSV